MYVMESLYNHADINGLTLLHSEQLKLYGLGCSECSMDITLMHSEQLKLHGFGCSECSMAITLLHSEQLNYGSGCSECSMFITLLHLDQLKLHRVLAVLSAVWLLISFTYCMV